MTEIIQQKQHLQTNRDCYLRKNKCSRKNIILSLDPFVLSALPSGSFSFPRGGLGFLAIPKTLPLFIINQQAYYILFSPFQNLANLFDHLPLSACLFYFIFIFNIIMTNPLNNPHADYFTNLFTSLKDPSTFRSKGKQLIEQAASKLEHKIMASQVTLPQEVGLKAIIIPKKKDASPSQNEQQLLKKVENEKTTLLQKIRDLSKQEDDLKQKLKASNRQNSHQRVYYKPNLSEQDQQRFNKALEKSRKYRKSMENKNKELKQLLREKSIQQIKMAEKQLQEKREQKRKSAIDHIRYINEKSQQRRRIQEQLLQNSLEVRENKYLYQKFQHIDEEIKLSQQKQYNRKLQLVRENAKLNIEEIKEHEKQYEEHLQEISLKIQQRSIQRSRNFSNKSYGDNYFTVVTKARMEKEKLQYFQRANQAHIFKERIEKFKQKVIKQFKPKISSKSKIPPLRQSLSVHALTNTQQRKKGLEYLQVSKKLKDEGKQKQRRMTHASPVRKSEYKDYTKELKYKGYETAQTKFNELIKNKSSLGNFEGASKALELAYQIEAKAKLTKDELLLHSARNKIELLNALS